jgi:hypothetical protein
VSSSTVGANEARKPRWDRLICAAAQAAADFPGCSSSGDTDAGSSSTSTVQRSALPRTESARSPSAIKAVDDPDRGRLRAGTHDDADRPVGDHRIKVRHEDSRDEQDGCAARFDRPCLLAFTPSMTGAQRAEATTTSGLAGPWTPWPVSEPWKARAPKPARVSMRSSSAAE